MTDQAKAFALHLLAAVLLPIAAGTTQAEAAAPTHERVATIEFRTATERTTLNTFCLDRAGHVLAACTGAGGAGEVRVLTAGGERVASWPVDFAPTAVNVAPDGQVYVAGEGHFVALDATGEVAHRGQLPQLGDPEQMRQAALEDAKKQQETMVASLTKNLDRYRQQIAELEQIAEADRDAAWQQKMRNLERLLGSLEKSVATRRQTNVESLAQGMLARKFKITSIAVSDGDVFVVAGARKGSGYELWRMSRTFGDAKCILEGMRGCCGQCDVQVCGDQVIFADNCQHRVARYDREGELVGTFGTRARDGGEGFGGCCNPMNTRVDSKGRIFTAESEGLVKCFSAEGELLATIASLAFTGGCKHIPVAVAEDTGDVFLQENNKGAIVVLRPKERTGSGDEAPR